LPEPIRVPGSQSIRARRRSQQNSPCNVHASGSHAVSASALSTRHQRRTSSCASIPWPPRRPLEER
jgi:hypothetical protein